jgi:hypothetical protein
MRLKGDAHEEMLDSGISDVALADARVRLDVR